MPVRIIFNINTLFFLRFFEHIDIIVEYKRYQLIRVRFMRLKRKDIPVKESAVVTEICNYIKAEVLYERITEHEKISERAISERFAVSRTIVREALQILKESGWLYSKSKSGTYVAELDIASIYENYMARLALEGEILLVAYQNITSADIQTMKENCYAMLNAPTIADYSRAENKQHLLISERTNNRYIQDFESAMMEGMVRIGGKAGRTGDRRVACVNEWLQIIKYLEQSNPVGASRAFLRHIQNSYDAFEKYYHPLTGHDA